MVVDHHTSVDSSINLSSILLLIYIFPNLFRAGRYQCAGGSDPLQHTLQPFDNQRLCYTMKETNWPIVPYHERESNKCRHTHIHNKKKQKSDHQSKKCPWRIFAIRFHSADVYPLGSFYSSFQPWKTCAINPFLNIYTVYSSLYFFPLYTDRLVCVVDWDVRVRTERATQCTDHHRWRDIEFGIYLLGGTQHGALFGAVLSRRNRPVDGWGSWPLAVVSMCVDRKSVV